jgi:hypothetical protein
MLLSNDQTVEPQEAMSQLFPSFQSDVCYLPSVTVLFVMWLVSNGGLWLHAVLNLRVLLPENKPVNILILWSPLTRSSSKRFEKFGSFEHGLP